MKAAGTKTTVIHENFCSFWAIFDFLILQAPGIYRLEYSNYISAVTIATFNTTRYYVIACRVMLRSCTASAPPVSLCFISADVISMGQKQRNRLIMYERNIDQLVCHLSTWTNTEVGDLFDSLRLQQSLRV